MISSINFLAPGISCKKLERYVLTEEDKKKFPGYNFSKVKNMEEGESDFEDERIRVDDIVFFCTANDEEQSYIDVIIGSKPPFLHHDVLISDVIYTGAYGQLGKKHYGALACSSPEVQLYDLLLYNPLVPQLTLQGHTGEVNAVEWTDTVYTGGADNLVIRWDMEKQLPNQTADFGMEVQILSLSENFIAGLLDENKIFVRDRNTLSDGALVKTQAVESLLLVEPENKIFASFEDGTVEVRDLRNLETILTTRKVDHGCISTMDHNGKYLFTGSTSKNMRILDTNTLQEQKKIKLEGEIYSLKICPYKKDMVAVGTTEIKLFDKIDI